MKWRLLELPTECQSFITNQIACFYAWVCSRRLDADRGRRNSRLQRRARVSGLKL
ncbi:unnamed protein product [Linum tenue]|uniref:Uncharacterized protein n=1 Tax=Linum tenue TaxID=586396 RepID=A0AAV0JYA6_9ROSI|nr:unnamed protein product [Linum tenue]